MLSGIEYIKNIGTFAAKPDEQADCRPASGYNPATPSSDALTRVAVAPAASARRWLVTRASIVTGGAYPGVL
jgi:hypothetical protein